MAEKPTRWCARDQCHKPVGLEHPHCYRASLPQGFPFMDSRAFSKLGRTKYVWELPRPTPGKINYKHATFRQTHRRPTAGADYARGTARIYFTADKEGFVVMSCDCSASQLTVPGIAFEHSYVVRHCGWFHSDDWQERVAGAGRDVFAEGKADATAGTACPHCGRAKRGASFFDGFHPDSRHYIARFVYFFEIQASDDPFDLAPRVRFADNTADHKGPKHAGTGKMLTVYDPPRKLRSQDYRPVLPPLSRNLQHLAGYLRPDHKDGHAPPGYWRVASYDELANREGIVRTWELEGCVVSAVRLILRL
eukprot:g6325.t1